MTFERKNKYIVIKLSRLNDNPTIRNKQLAELNMYSDAFVESVVVEADKPEYEDVWGLVQARIENKPNVIKDQRKYIERLEGALNYYTDAERKDETCGGGYYSFVEDGSVAREALASKPKDIV